MSVQETRVKGIHGSWITTNGVITGSTARSPGTMHTYKRESPGAESLALQFSEIKYI